MLGAKVGPLKLEGMQDGLDYSDMSVSWIKAKKLRFIDCDFSHAHVTNSYFHRAEFVGCKFIGATFVDCNFRGASFRNCRFEYCTFRNSPVEISEVKKNCPEWENVRRELFQSLRKNFEGVGDIDSARVAFRAEMEASYEHWRSATRGTTGYYQTHYAKGKKFTAGWKQASLFISRNVWGYGESPWRLLISIFVVNLMFAGWSAFYPECRSDGFLAHLASQFSIFLGLESGLKVGCQLSPWFLIMETFIRFLCLGLIGGVVIRRYVRR